MREAANQRGPIKLLELIQHTAINDPSNDLPRIVWRTQIGWDNPH